MRGAFEPVASWLAAGRSEPAAPGSASYRWAQRSQLKGPRWLGAATGWELHSSCKRKHWGSAGRVTWGQHGGNMGTTLGSGAMQLPEGTPGRMGRHT